MFSLVIDTSTERACAFFFNGQDVLFQGQLPFGLNHTKHLLPEIEQGFNFLGKRADELDFIAVGIGPGSYTGMRAGVIIAKTLAFALKKPLVTFCSLEAFTSSQEGRFAVVLDAKISGVYVLKGSHQKHMNKTEEQAQIISLNDFGDYLSDIPILVTPNMSMIKKKVEDLYPKHDWVWEEREPDLLHLGQLTSLKFERGEYSDGKHLELLYLRKTQAEIEKEQQNRIRY